MVDPDAVEMPPEKRDDFLGRSGTGVLSLSTPDGEAPHSVPVSYGYDAEEEVFYFRIAAGTDTTKGDLAGRTVTFVTHGQDGDTWKSVVATGTLTDVDEEPIDALEGLERVHIPLVDIFGEPPGEVTFEFLRLVHDQLTARKETQTGR